MQMKTSWNTTYVLGLRVEVFATHMKSRWDHWFQMQVADRLSTFLDGIMAHEHLAPARYHEPLHGAKGLQRGTFF